MQLRAFELDDAGACCRVINAALTTMSGLNAAARALLAAKNVPSRLGPELALLHVLVAVVGSDIVGVGALDGNEIKRVFVEPASQRCGIGGAILSALEVEARRTGVSLIVLQASPSSASFYLRHGYRSLGEEHSENGEATFVHVRMEKPLG